jgi:hypothetical protein
MLRAIPLGRLGGDKRQNPAHDILMIGTTVKVHRHRHLVDSLQRDLRHLVPGTLTPVKTHLARIEVMQRRSAGKRLEPPDQALVMESDRTVAIRRCHGTKVIDATDIFGKPQGP